MTPLQLRTIAWSTSLGSLLLALLAWGGYYQWDLSGITLYQYFPLLGLTAYSLMWAHYIAAALRMGFHLDKQSLHSYFQATSRIVLFCLLMHPGLLAYQRWRDGAGLPPGSTLTYVQESARLFIVFGIVALAAFLTYEFKRVLERRAVWHWIERASDVAMILIFFHALKLGTHVQTGWYRGVWWFYGMTLAIALCYIYFYLVTHRSKPAS